MKKIPILALLACAALNAHGADVNVNIGGVRIDAPGVSITFGTRDARGYYWDGYDYRDPDYWRRHDGHRGERYYTGRRDQGVPHQDGGHCPPGQAKKGRC